MDDSDDYLFDEIIIDAAALDIIKAIEVRAQQDEQNAQRRPNSPNAPLPPAKRQKISEHASRPVIRSRYTSGDDIEEDLPDIAVDDNGRYGISNARNQAQPTYAEEGSVAAFNANGIGPSTRFHAPIESSPVAGPSRLHPPPTSTSSRPAGNLQRRSSTPTAIETSKPSGASLSRNLHGLSKSKVGPIAFDEIVGAMRDAPRNGALVLTPPPQSDSPKPPLHQPPGQHVIPSERRQSPALAPRVAAGALSPLARASSSYSPQQPPPRPPLQQNHRQRAGVVSQRRAVSPPSALPQIPLPQVQQQQQQRYLAPTRLPNAQSELSLRQELDNLKSQMENVGTRAEHL